jgi:glycosyltransferase involved in cell wall biosynthesis
MNSLSAAIAPFLPFAATMIRQMTGPGEPALTLVNLGDPANPETQSGVALSLGKALRRAGAGISTDGVLTGSLEHRVYWRSMRSSVGARVMRSSRVVGLLSRRLGSRLADTNGIPILISSDLLMPRGMPFATWDDQTIAQRRRAGLLGRWGERNIEAAITRQADQCRRAKVCFVATEWAAESMINEYRVSPDRVVVVGRASNLDTSPTARDWSIPRFLFPCSSWEGKNGPRVIAAFERLRTSIPEATLTVIGRHPVINRPNVIELGWISLGDVAQKRRLEQAYSEATCLLIPSLQEATGISAIEGGRAGIPSIGTVNGGVRHVIGPGGATVDPVDVEALVAAMIRFSDPTEAERVGRLALDHTKDMTWDTIAERVISALA